MADFITLGCECGGPEDGGIRDLKVGIYRSLVKHVTSTHCPAIDEYAPVLRVDGRFKTFGEEGVTRLRFAKKKRYITVDIQIPESTWRTKDRKELASYLAQQVRLAITKCVERLTRDGHTVNEQALYQQIDRANREYLANGG